MSEQKAYVGDVGTVIELDAGIDLSSQTSIAINVRKPDGSEVVWTATVRGSDPTKAYHVAAAGDLDQAGTYLLQLAATLTGPAGTWTGLGRTAILRVWEPYS